MQDKLAQAGLFITGLLGIIGGLRGVQDSDPWMVGMGLFPAFLSFTALLVLYFFSYIKLKK